MSAEQNIATVRRVIDEFNRGNLDVLDEVCSPDYIFHGPTNPDWDREGIKKAIGMVHAAFPDWQITLEDIFATQDRAAYRISIRGTHRGEVWGATPTGKQMTWTAILIDHFAGGKIVEDWEWTDFLGLMQQLGVVSLPG